MVKFGPADLATVMEMGAEAADFVTGKFVKPIKLEFEKVYFPYLLISKKRYAGLYWTKTEKYDKLDSKGIEVSGGAACLIFGRAIWMGADKGSRLYDEITVGWCRRSLRRVCIRCSLTGM